MVGLLGGAKLSNNYDFTGQLLFSHGVCEKEGIADILIDNIPNVIEIKKATLNEDKNGTDFWAVREGLPALSIDVKIRKTDPIKFNPPEDDLALETFSVLENKTIGWTRNESKRTDYILWYWTQTKRWCLIPFPLLCRIFQENWQIYRKKYKTRQQQSERWKSECVFVPRREIWAEIYRKYSGNVTKII